MGPDSISSEDPSIIHPPALLIIDMITLRNFKNADQERISAARASKHIQVLRKEFHDRSWPVIFVNDDLGERYADLRELVKMAMTAGYAAARIAMRLDPSDQDYFVRKTEHSAFLATPLSDLLEKLRVRRLLLTGMALEDSVLATAIDAKARHFTTAVAKEASAGRSGLRIRTFKFLRGSEVADVVTCQRAIGWASRSLWT